MENLTEIKAGNTGHGLLIERDGSLRGNNDVVNQIREDINKKKDFVIPDRFIVSAIFQRYGAKNANGRIYPENVLKPQVEKYIQERVNNHCAIAALDHPESESLSLKDVTHNILSLEWDGCQLVGEMELHLTPGYRRYGIATTSGDFVANLILDGIQIGVSSRGVGDVEKKFGDLIVTEYELISFDVVAEPSTHNAWIKPSRADLAQYYESKEKEHKGNRLDEALKKIGLILG